MLLQETHRVHRMGFLGRPGAGLESPEGRGIKRRTKSRSYPGGGMFHVKGGM